MSIFLTIVVRKLPTFFDEFQTNSLSKFFIDAQYRSLVTIL